ncbi:DUF2807 domain-containing protein [Flavobacterium agricola]|uniref:DUF2807 domain-containing protein n=1 Tax=Flavobacterium agricola TaxID=2870839 RepID=A0ABY6M0B2_9FLAO|nr:DUF2807 domain-containing protein [Flavobacterium agricola]
MIRFTLYYIKLIIAFITALFFTSCNLNFNGMETIAHKGDIIKKEISLPSSFNKIKVSNALHVIVSQNAETKVWVEAHENLHEHISVSVEKETLVIKKDKNFKSNSVNTIYVTAPNIEKLKASSGYYKIV